MQIQYNLHCTIVIAYFIHFSNYGVRIPNPIRILSYKYHIFVVYFQVSSAATIASCAVMFELPILQFFGLLKSPAKLLVEMLTVDTKNKQRQR